MIRRLLLLAVLLPAAEAQQPGGSRYALILANSKYQLLPRVSSSVAEADLVQSALADAGFKVTRKDDLGFQQFLGELTRFATALHPGDTAFFYFSGYTAVDGDDNYLLPADFDAKSADDLQARALRLRLVQQRLSQKEGLKVLVLEAPHALDVPIRGATEAGVQQPSITESRETLVAFAASPGDALLAPSAGAGLFTTQLAENIRKHGLLLQRVFQDSRTAVARVSERRQTPLLVDNVTTDFYFHDADPVKPVAPPKPEVVTVIKEAPLRPGFPVNNPRDHEDYVWIPAGEFKMGCATGDDRCLANELPQHPVSIAKGFWMGRNEVQVSSYKRYLVAQTDATKKKMSMPGAPPDYNKWNIPDYPMVSISWNDAEAYCGWAHGRLPTEAEWEYAARAGSEAIYPFNGENSRDKANFEGKHGADIFDRVAPVHSFTANAWGLHDMAGNVWEWVSDLYSATYYQESPKADPQGPKTGKDHVKRGGSFDSLADKHLRISVRGPGMTGNIVGFRCILEDSPATNQLLGR